LFFFSSFFPDFGTLMGGFFAYSLLLDTIGFCSCAFFCFLFVLFFGFLGCFFLCLFGVVVFRFCRLEFLCRFRSAHVFLWFFCELFFISGWVRYDFS